MEVRLRYLGIHYLIQYVSGNYKLVSPIGQTIGFGLPHILVTLI